MRTIAGQIENFDFNSVDSGVNDPTFGNDVESIFKAQWQKQIENWLATSGAPVLIDIVPVDAGNFGGNEHLGANLGGTSTLPDLEQDISFPPGAAFTFQYSIDAVVAKTNGLWIIATGDNGRVGTDGKPNPKGPIELKTISMVSSSNTWTTTVTGTYHTPYDLPAVPFTITLIETVSIFQASSPASFTLNYTASRALDANTKDLQAAITAIEVLGVGAIANLTYGPFINSTLAQLFDSVEGYIRSQISALQSVSLPLTPLADAMKSMPQRLQLPGTVDDVWFDYDTVSAPQGLICEGTAEANELTFYIKGGAVVFSGDAKPTRSRRIAWALISGQSSVVLVIPTGLPGVSAPLAQAGQYMAIFSDELESPTFSWAVTTLNGASLPSVQILNQHSQTAEIVFNANGRATPSETILLTLHMDDSQHLKDQSGHSPSASMYIAISHKMVASPTMGRGPIIKPVRSKAQTV